MKPPETRYARSGDVRIAYQVIGNGPIDLVFVPGFLSNLEVHWEDPGYTVTCSSGSALLHGSSSSTNVAPASATGSTTAICRTSKPGWTMFPPSWMRPAAAVRRCLAPPNPPQCLFCLPPPLPLLPAPSSSTPVRPTSH